MNPLRRTIVFGAPALALRAQPRANIIWTKTITNQPNSYHGWPTLAQRDNGELLVVCSGGREGHVCPFGRVELIRSTDGGETWSWPEVLMDTVIDDRDAGVLVTPRGSILVTTFTSLAYEPLLEKSNDWDAAKRDRWQAVNRRATAAQRKAMLGTWLLRSADGGMTWSAPGRVPVNSPHGPINGPNGRVLYPGKQIWAGDRNGVAESSDDGKSWRWLSTIPTRPGDDPVNYHELHGVLAANGQVIVHIRNHNKANGGETLQCESKDGGKSWTAPHPIGVWGLPSHLLRLRDGRLLMSYGYRRAPFGNQARVSSDHGKTWSEPVTISADGASGDLGYPSTVETANGQLLTMWYEKPKSGPFAALRMSRWTLG